MCRPNFSAAGRARRLRVAQVGAVIAVGLLVALVVSGAGWPWRLLVGLPAGAALVSGLQVRRNTCVAHAATGVFENEDFTTTKVEDELRPLGRNLATSAAHGAAQIAMGETLGTTCLLGVICAARCAPPVCPGAT